MPRCAPSTASSIAMTATGSKAAPRWSSMRAASWKSSNGRSFVSKLHQNASAPPHNRIRAPRQLRILFITDAWHPQINGVVRTLSTTGRELEKMGHTVGFIGPDQFRTIPLVGYTEIQV